jgi:energy-coupling factor transport system permease protein
MSSLTDAQERGMTLETRGFGISGTRQTSYVQVRVRTCDRLADALLISFFILVAGVSILQYTGVLMITFPWVGA